MLMVTLWDQSQCLSDEVAVLQQKLSELMTAGAEDDGQASGSGKPSEAVDPPFDTTVKGKGKGEEKGKPSRGGWMPKMAELIAALYAGQEDLVNRLADKLCHESKLLNNLVEKVMHRRKQHRHDPPEDSSNA